MGVPEFKNPNISFSGCDMVATISVPTARHGTLTRALGSLQTLSYSTHMDKKPIRALSQVTPKAYVNGPRTIAGTLVFAVFDQHFVKELYQDTDDYRMYARYMMADELPPFDITVSMANEYGAKSRMAIYGVTLINEGKAISVNDVYTENTYQFLATDIEYLEAEDHINRRSYVQDEEAEEETSDDEYSQKALEEIQNGVDGATNETEGG